MEHKRYHCRTIVLRIRNVNFLLTPTVTEELNADIALTTHCTPQTSGAATHCMAHLPAAGPAAGRSAGRTARSRQDWHSQPPWLAGGERGRHSPLSSASGQRGPTWLAVSWVSMACSLSAGVVAGVSSTSLVLVGVTGGQRSEVRR